MAKKESFYQPALSAGPAVSRSGSSTLPPQVRMEDIAQRAGVSRRAVSRVLFPDGSKGIRVGEKTAERIRHIAEEMGYTPNLSARQLAGADSGLIGVLIDSFASPVFYEMIPHLERVLASKGYRILIGQVHYDIDANVETIAGYLRDFAGRKVDGVVSYVHGYPGFADMVRKFCQSVGNVVYVGLPRLPGEDSVSVDTAEGVRMLVRHLHTKGKRRIAMLVPQGGYATIAARERGFQTEIGELKLNLVECPVWFFARATNSAAGARNPGWEQLWGELTRFWEKHSGVDAIIAVNDMIALAVIQFLMARGISMPGQVAVAGFDNIEMGAFATPSLTTIDQCSAEVAGHVADLLLSRMADKERNCRSVVVMPKLIIRESTTGTRVPLHVPT